MELIIPLITLSAAGWIIVSYPSFAQAQGWPIGAAFHGGSLGLVGMGAAFGPPIVSVFVNPWWSFLVVVASGWIGAFVLTQLLREKAQIASLGLLGVGGLLFLI